MAAFAKMGTTARKGADGVLAGLDLKKLGEPQWTRRFIFLYEIVFLAILLALAFAYLKEGSFFRSIPSQLRGLPVYSAWFGALGGITISLKGVYGHAPTSADGKSFWGGKWPLWYIGRPFSGLVAGIVTIVLLRAVYPSGTPTTAVVEAAAFILGTQESRFFAFLAAVGNLVVNVPSKDLKDVNGNKE